MIGFIFVSSETVRNSITHWLSISLEYKDLSISLSVWDSLFFKSNIWYFIYGFADKLEHIRTTPLTCLPEVSNLSKVYPRKIGNKLLPGCLTNGNVFLGPQRKAFLLPLQVANPKCMALCFAKPDTRDQLIFSLPQCQTFQTSQCRSLGPAICLKFKEVTQEKQKL